MGSLMDFLYTNKTSKIIKYLPQKYVNRNIRILTVTLLNSMETLFTQMILSKSL